MRTVLINLVWLGLWSFATACDSKLEVTTQDLGPPQEEAIKSPIAAKLSASDCVDPNLEEIPINVSLTICNGELAQGLLELPQECTADGMTGCLTTDAFKSADMTFVVATNIKNGATIAGISGSVAESPAPCATDGGVGCVVLGPAFKAASMSNFTANSVRSGVTVAGVAGSLSDCSANDVAGCVTTSTYKSADLTNLAPGNIKDAVTIAGGDSGDFQWEDTFRNEKELRAVTLSSFNWS